VSAPAVTVEEALGRLGVSRLAHFTPAQNLFHILEDGLIRSSKDLADNAPGYFTPTDRERFDRQPDKICCSFEYPNGYYLASARQRPEFTNYPDWVCLLLDHKLILRPGTLFCPCNAATGSGAYARPGGDALLACFAQSAGPGGWQRGALHHPGAATDLQAEALVPGPVDLSHLRGIVVASDAEALQHHGALARFGFSPEQFRWIVAPAFFDRNILSRKVRYGGTVSETDWIAPVIQEVD
jgi:hypothetical protein